MILAYSIVAAPSFSWGGPHGWAWWSWQGRRGGGPQPNDVGGRGSLLKVGTLWRIWRAWKRFLNTRWPHGAIGGTEVKSEPNYWSPVNDSIFREQLVTVRTSTHFPYIYIFCKKFKVITVGFSVSWHCRSDSLAGKVWTLLGSWTINWSPMWPSIREDVFVTYTVWFESLLYIFAKVGTLVSQHHHSLSLLDNQTPSERFRQVLDM